MQTHFTPDQKKQPHIQEADAILRACVHCGFCTATCPTYVTLGDELDSPRGRIYLMKTMLEDDRPADVQTVKHLDRCLTCHSCMTTCPSGVDYGHLLEIGRTHVARTYQRPLLDQGLRWFVQALVTRPGLFRYAARIGRLFTPFQGIFPHKIRPFLRQVPQVGPKEGPLSAPGVHAPDSETQGKRRMRVGMPRGCVQRAVAPEINEATVRLLNRLGAEVVILEDSACCGAMAHHLGHDVTSTVIDHVQAWQTEKKARGLDAIVSNASGCGAMIKEYGHILRHDPEWAAAGAEISGLTQDVSTILDRLSVKDKSVKQALPRVTYHAACSLQHGQKIRDLPKTLLRQVGFDVCEPTDPHLCCGSAGTYSILQSDIAHRLRARKVKTIAATQADVVALGNIGCLLHLRAGMSVPVVHSVQLLDWATGGPRPEALSQG